MLLCEAHIGHTACGLNGSISNDAIDVPEKYSAVTLYKRVSGCEARTVSKRTYGKGVHSRQQKGIPWKLYQHISSFYPPIDGMLQPISILIARFKRITESNYLNNKYFPIQGCTSNCFSLSTYSDVEFS